jgi:hypothetical protein
MNMNRTPLFSPLLIATSMVEKGRAADIHHVRYRTGRWLEVCSVWITTSTCKQFHPHLKKTMQSVYDLLRLTKVCDRNGQNRWMAGNALSEERHLHVLACCVWIIGALGGNLHFV